jgi:hypothetical protein
MPSNVFDRTMFKAESKPLKADSGIMQGFEEDEGEIPEDEMMEEISQRKPNSPEILMNNLRGDMRSVDARYQELADMVGEDVAMETPPEVLALLQAQLAQQSMGIGALPPGQGVPPPPMPAGAPPMPTPDMMGGMPQPGAMPQGPESQMPPQGFADGGMVGGVPGYAFGGIIGRVVNQVKPTISAAATPAPDPAVLEQQRRDFAFNNPYTTQAPAPAPASGIFRGLSRFFNNTTPAASTARPTLNPEFAVEFARRFNRGPGVQVPTQQQTLVPTPQFAEGGIASLGNFSEGVAQAGRNGDTVLAHMTPEQHQYLTELGGGATVNPQTGLPEHYMGAQMLSNLGQRAMPYLQQANVLAGRALYNPTFSAPVLNQARDASGRFGPMSFEGMNMYYPTLTQGLANTRVGQMAVQGAEKLSKLPMGEKVLGAMGSTAIGQNIYNRMGGNMSVENNRPPIIPGDPATDPAKRGMPVVEEEVAPESTPINYNNLPAAPGAAAPAAAPTTEAERNNQLIQSAIAKKTRGERLEDYMSENVPIFEKYLGGDKDYNQAQALFVLADMGLKFASSRKPGDTFASAFARSAQGVPSGLSAIAAAEDQAKRQIKSAALTSGLQTIAAEDKAAADIAKAIATKTAQGQKMTYEDLGAGMSRVKDGNGKLIGHVVEQYAKDAFAENPIVPLKKVDEKNYERTSPYAKITPNPAPTTLTKSIRDNIETQMISSGDMVNMIDNTMKDIASVYGPGAWATDFKNNIIVPVTPNLVASPNTDFEAKRANVGITLKQVNTALAKSGDSGNTAVYERKLVEKITGKDPAAFFADPELIMKNMSAIRTFFANDYYRKGAQLGLTDYNIKLDVPNLGTQNDPIPQDKLPFLKQLAETNPNGQVYVKYGKTVEPVLLNTLK